MKIAVTSRGGTLDSRMDPAFGRAKGFIVVDTDSGEFVFVGNEQNVNAAQGAGIQAAANVAGLGVACVISGHCGPKAFRTLAAAGIDVVLGADGTVGEVLERFKAGELSPSEGADVESHWV
jgi:predicted Fe-Mo cluster-binding NifX family protein